MQTTMQDNTATNSDYVLEDEEDLIKEHETTFSKCHGFCGRIVNDDSFQNGVIVLIILNSLTMAIATFDFVRNNEAIDNAFEIVDRIFLLIFTFELILNLIYHGVCAFLSDSWLMFDFIVISLSWGFRGLSVIRTFRVLRVLRLVTKMKAMRNIVTALSGILPRMVAIFMLLSLIYFVFCVMFTEMFGSLYEEGYTSEDFFSRLDKTCFTLLRLMLLDNWADVIIETCAKYWWAWIPLLTFIVVSTFIVVNLIIAVICDAVSSIQTEEMTKQVVEIQRQTSTVLHNTEAAHERDTRSMEAKLDELTRLIATMQKPEAKVL